LATITFWEITSITFYI